MHFHYSGGGFPLHRAVYRTERIVAPIIPTAQRVREQMTMAAKDAFAAAPTEDAIAKSLAEAEAGYAAVLAAWELAPYEIIVSIPGTTARHYLRYQNAVRFLRQLGVLRRCDGCEQWAISYEPRLDPDVILCDRCGYTSLSLSE
ncbi:hypothetical protein EKD04_017290 [Chloroflexales bacterium ZM16-3]|nr:hypothetical protein [Chloroflexales bacterium ZM16-3]